MKQNIADNHSKNNNLLPCTALQHSPLFEVVLVTCGKHACFTEKHGHSRRGRLIAISRSFTVKILSAFRLLFENDFH